MLAQSVAQAVQRSVSPSDASLIGKTDRSLPELCTLIRMPDAVAGISDPALLLCGIDARPVSLLSQDTVESYHAIEPLYDYTLDYALSSRSTASLAVNLLDEEQDRERGSFNLCCIVGNQGQILRLYDSRSGSDMSIKLSLVASHEMGYEQSVLVSNICSRTRSRARDGKISVLVCKLHSNVSL